MLNNLQVGILKRVLEEVEKVMQEFRGMLYKSMEDPHLDLAEVSGTWL
jgi:exocyst complex component 2